jgi:hypothetical protein
MDSATILMLLLCAGVVALLIWFEINSRRNEASKTAQSASVEALPKESQTTVEAKGDKRKAA